MDYKNLDAINRLPDSCRAKVERFVNSWSKELEENILDDYTFSEVMRHVIAHEIHHIGQLSVWIRELGFEPVSSNVIGQNIRQIDSTMYILRKAGVAFGYNLEMACHLYIGNRGWDLVYTK